MNAKPKTPSKEDLRAEEAAVHAKSMTSHAHVMAIDLLLKFSGPESVVIAEMILGMVMASTVSRSAIDKSMGTVDRQVREFYDDALTRAEKVAHELGIKI